MTLNQLNFANNHFGNDYSNFNENLIFAVKNRNFLILNAKVIIRCEVDISELKF